MTSSTPPRTPEPARPDIPPPIDTPDREPTPIEDPRIPPGQDPDIAPDIDRPEIEPGETPQELPPDSLPGGLPFVEQPPPEI